MKKSILYIASAAILLSSCYKDQSTQATVTIPEITIETESDILNVAYGHDLIVNPTVSREGRTEEDFDYQWEMDLTSGSKTNRLDLGTEHTLNYKVGNSPSERPYYLTLQVTDRETGLSKYHEWSVYVSSSLGEGIIVGYLNADGTTSDIDLISSKNVTYGYASETPMVTRNLYSLGNGAPIAGKIQSLLNQVVTDGATFNTSRIVFGTETDLVALASIDYKESKRNVNLFNNSHVSEFAAQMLFNFGAYDTAALIGDVLYTIVCNSDLSYTKVPANFPVKQRAIAYAKPDQGKVLIFDEEGAKFHYILPYAPSSISEISSPNLPFSPVGATALGGGSLKESVLGIILKAADSSHYLVTFDLTAMNPSAVTYQIPATAPDIDNAISFAFCDNSMLFFYATDSKIYTNIVRASGVTTKALSWKPESADEKITGITQYAQNWWGTCQNFTPYEFTIDTHRVQMVITTYNEKKKEGKVYLCPFNVTTGLFTGKSNGIFGGFGEIKAIATTSK